jgi:hypothetical protein
MMELDDERYMGNHDAFEIQQRTLRNNSERAMIDMARMMREQQYGYPQPYIRPRHRVLRFVRAAINLAGVILILATAFGILEFLLTGH